MPSGLCGVAAGAAFSVGATLFSPNFSKFMSTSAKTSFPVMAGLGLFTYGYEISMHDAMRCVLKQFHLHLSQSNYHDHPVELKENSGGENIITNGENYGNELLICMHAPNPLDKSV